MNLHEAAERFYGYLGDVRGYSEHTVRSYAQAIDAMLEVAHLEKEDETHILDITPYRMRIASLSKKSIALKLTAIRRFAAYLQTYEKRNVELRGESRIKVPKTLPKPVEHTHIIEALSLASLQERLIAMMLYGLGLRIGELASLRTEQIRGSWIEVEGKGKKTRHIPLPLKVQETLQEYLKSHSPKRYLFEKGNAPMNEAQLRYRVQKLFARVGIRTTPHRLRHSFATHLLNEGARIADVSELLGHSSMATTQIYTKLSSTKKMREYLNAHPLVKEEKEE